MRINVPHLIQDYLSEKEELAPFYTHSPSIKGLVEAASARPQVDRETLVKVLKEQAGDSPYAKSKTFDQIDRLLNEDVFTITTGHQLCLYGGPMFFWYKMLSIIKLSDELKQKGVDTVPVYWMASEDHDFDEINHIFIGEKKVSWDVEVSGAVGRLKLEGLDAFKTQLAEHFSSDPLKLVTLEELDKIYAADRTLSQATRDLVYWIMGELGIVVIDADDRRLKSAFRNAAAKELNESFSEHAVKHATDRLTELGYSAQINPREINLFWMESGVRERIVKSERGFETADGSHTWSQEELEQLLNDNPEYFSPNVVLRPLYQEMILPNLAYIGGPGELSYWLQLKGVFKQAEVFFPALVLRDMALISSAKLEKRMRQLDIKVSDIYTQDESALFTALIRKQGSHEGIVETTEEKVEIELGQLINDLKSIDPTLAESAEAERKRILNRLEVLRKKVLRSDRKANSDIERRLHEAFAEIKPNGIPQERVHSWLMHTSSSTAVDFFQDLMVLFDPFDGEFKVIGV